MSIKLPKVAIIVLNWDGKKYLQDCLPKLIKTTYKNKEIFVVDNNSSDGSQAYVKKFPKIHLIENKENLGWVGGNNIGIQNALRLNPDAIMLLNNDITPTRSFIEPLVAALFEKESVGIVGPILLVHNSKNRIADAGGIIKSKRFFAINRGCNLIMTKKYEKVTKVDYIIGAAMLIKRDVFKKIGLFNKDYFIYYDDTDFGVRARDAGFESYIIPQSKLFHRVSGTVKVGSPFHHYYTTRNHLLFMERNAPKKLMIRELIRMPKTVYEFITSKDKVNKTYSLLGIRDYFLRRFGKRTYW
jgi:GT2 family glycosyltransferase